MSKKTKNIKIKGNNKDELNPKELDDIVKKESLDNSIPLDSGDWVANLNEGDLIYSAGYERDEDGKERVTTLTLKFLEYDKNSIATKNVLMAKLAPVVDGKVPENVTLPSQNIRVGFFKTKVEAIRAFEKTISHMADVIKETADRLEAEENTVKVDVNSDNNQNNENDK